MLNVSRERDVTTSGLREKGFSLYITDFLELTLIDVSCEVRSPPSCLNIFLEALMTFCQWGEFVGDVRVASGQAKFKEIFPETRVDAFFESLKCFVKL